MVIAVANHGFVVPKELRGTESFLLYDIVNGKATNERELVFTGSDMTALLTLLKQSGAELLICGTLDAADRHLLEEGGLQVIYGITTVVAVALSRYEDGLLVNQDTSAPGRKESTQRAYCSGNCPVCPNPCH